MEFSAEKVAALLILAVFITGVSTIFLRRHAGWSLVGQLIAVKAVVAAGFILSGSAMRGQSELAMIALISLGLVPAVGFIGILALHRCGRFGGTLNYDEEDNLHN